MRRFLPLLLLAACAPAEMPAPPAPPEAMCDAARAQNVIGQPATPEIAAQARDAASARTIRWTRPGMAVTMDYRPDRLNIEIGADETIVKLSCG